MGDKLRRNTLPDGYIYDPREGRQIPGNMVLPSMPKHRLEQTAFLEGASWIMEHLLTYKIDVPDITSAVLAEARKRYPDYD